MRKANTIKYITMRKANIFVIILLAVAGISLVCGCKSHKKVVVSAQPEFVADEMWQLTTMRGKEVLFLEGQKPIMIQINPEAGTFSGNSGCNRYNGTIKIEGKNRITLSDFNGTKKACPDDFHKMENTYIQLLRHCNNYQLDAYSLKLMQDEKVLLMFEKIEE